LHEFLLKIIAAVHRDNDYTRIMLNLFIFFLFFCDGRIQGLLANTCRTKELKN